MANWICFALFGRPRRGNPILKRMRLFASQNPLITKVAVHQQGVVASWSHTSLTPRLAIQLRHITPLFYSPLGKGRMNCVDGELGLLRLQKQARNDKGSGSLTGELFLATKCQCESRQTNVGTARSNLISAGRKRLRFISRHLLTTSDESAS